MRRRTIRPPKSGAFFIETKRQHYDIGKPVTGAARENRALDEKLLALLAERRELAVEWEKPNCSRIARYVILIVNAITGKINYAR